MHSPHILVTSVCFCVHICSCSFSSLELSKRNVISWIPSKQSVEIGCLAHVCGVLTLSNSYLCFSTTNSDTSWLAGHLEWSWPLIALLLWYCSFCFCTPCLFWFLEMSGFSTRGWPKGVGMRRDRLMPAPGSVFACSDMEQRLGWALAWRPGLLGSCWLLLPSSCGFISTEPKYFSLMKTERLLLWEWCAVWVPPSVHHPPKVIWASGNLCFTGLLQGLALLVFSAWP